MEGTAVKCADPKLCYTSNGKKQLRHWSLASHIFRQVAQQVFACGQCLFCRKKRAYELACRCVLHSSLYKQNAFVTLTYDEKREGYHNNFQYEDIQKFKKRIRQYCQREYGKKIEVFNVHEYGKNRKKHWHLIVFNHDWSDKTLHTMAGGQPLYTSKLLEAQWPYGFNTLGDVSAASAMYQAQYVEKDLKNGHRNSDKESHSKHSGIGKPYFLKNYEQILQLGYVPIEGKKMPIPRYFQKLAHRHYCHFYEKSAFFDLTYRKALYRPFKKEEPNLRIANLYKGFAHKREVYKKDLETQWDEVILNYMNGEQPDFLKAGENALYDLKNKIGNERF